MTEILGLSAPRLLGPFAVVQIGDISLDYLGTKGEIPPQHYAFLVSEFEFDQIFERICERGLQYWADPDRKEPGHTNKWDDGRGVYFDDPNGHLLEIITRPYGSGGTLASHPHPLVAPALDPLDHEKPPSDSQARSPRGVSVRSANHPTIARISGAPLGPA